jgi:hypothetical protein
MWTNKRSNASVRVTFYILIQRVETFVSADISQKQCMFKITEKNI